MENRLVKPDSERKEVRKFDPHWAITLPLSVGGAIALIAAWDVSPLFRLAMIGLLIALSALLVLWCLVAIARYAMKPYYWDYGPHGSHISMLGLLSDRNAYQEMSHTVSSVESFSPGLLPEASVATKEATSFSMPAPQQKVPTLAEAFVSGIIEGSEGFLMGYNSQFQPVVGDIGSNKMMLVGGETTSGKSNTLFLLALQHWMKGHSVMVCDPHATKNRSISQLLAPIRSGIAFAADMNELSRMVDAYYVELQQRMEGRRGKPCVLIFDEWTYYSNTDMGRQMSTLIEKIAQGGSSYGMYLILAGQLWKSTRSGGTELRRSFVSSVCHRLAEEESKHILSNNPVWAKRTPSLETGTAIYKSGRAFEIIHVPLGIQDDALTAIQIAERIRR